MDATDQKSDENCITDDGVCEEAPDKVGQPLGPPAVSHEMGDDTIVDTVDDGALDLPNDDTIVEQVNDASLDLPDDDTIVDQVYNNPSDLPNDSGEEAVGQLDEDLGRPDHSESEEITPFSQLEQANNMREGFGDLQEQTLTTVMHQTSAGIDFELGSIPHAISSESSTKLHVTSALAASRPQVHPSPDDGWFSTMKQQGEWERPTLRNCRESVYSDAHPVQDVFALRRLLPFADSPVLRKEEYAGSQPRVAFFTGATGFIGSLVLASLLHIAPSTTFVCLVRANSKESALQRVIVGLQESNLWHPSFQNQIKAMKGDFEKPLMGLSMTDFRHLAESADVVYHFGGSGPNKRELELYSGSPRASNLIALQHVLRLCITTRPKPLHVVSSLDVWEPVLTYGRYGTPIDPSSDIQRIPEKGCKVSVRDLESQFPVASSTVAGHAWSKIAAEEVFSYSRRCGLAVVVYRVPPVFLTCAAAVDLRSIFSTLLLAACGLGIFPVDERGLCPLPLLAADAVATRIARLSLLPRSQRQYNAYHVLPSVENIETGTLCVDAASLSSWAKEFGFLGEFRPVNLEVFLDAVQKSRLSGMHTILSQLRDFALWSLPPGNNTYTWTILNDCLQKDITLTSRMLQEAHRGNRTDPEAGTTSPIRNSAVGAWPSPRRVFHRGLASLLRKCSQRVDTLAISGSLSMCTVDLCVAEALRRFPSLELDSTSNEILQFVSAGWRVFFHALRTDGAPLLEATIFIDRLIVSHSITLLHFLKRERHLRDRTYSEDDTRRKDKIEEVANSPLFICGLNEDTCTMLQELLRIDNRLCIVPTAAELLSPFGVNGEVYDVVDEKSDPRWTPAEYLNLRSGYAYCKEHELRSKPMDDSAIFEIFGRSLGLNSRYYVPTYQKWLLNQTSQDLSRLFHLYRRLVFHLTTIRATQTLTPERRWVFRVKSCNIVYLNHYKSALPNAVFVHMHSHPAAEIPSMFFNAQRLRQEAGLLLTSNADDDHEAMLAYVITHFEKSIEVYLECRHAEKTKLCIDVPQLLDDSPFSGLEAESLRRPPAKQTSALSEYSTRRQESPPVHIDVSAKSFLINPIAAIKTVYRGVPAWKSLAPDAFEAMWSFLFDHLNEWKVLSSKLGETDTKKVREKGLRDIGLDPEFVSAYLSGLLTLLSFERYVSRYLVTEDDVGGFEVGLSKKSAMSKLHLTFEAVGRMLPGKKK